MPVTFCVLLWAVEGKRDELAGYEDAVLALLPAHDGRVVSRLENSGDGADEVQVIEFADDAGFDGFMADPARLALSDQRDACIARTELMRVTPRRP